MTSKINVSYIYKKQTESIEPRETSPGKFYYWDKISQQWIYNLDEAKASKWAEIKNIRTQKESEGFEYSGNIFDSNQVSQSKIQGAVLLANNVGSTFSIDWTLANNSVITLNQQDMIGVGVAMGIHINSVYETARTLRAQIDQATDQQQLDAIVWPNA